MHRRLLSPHVRLFWAASVLDVSLLLLAHFYPLRVARPIFFRAGRLGRCSPASCFQLVRARCAPRTFTSKLVVKFGLTILMLLPVCTAEPLLARAALSLARFARLAVGGAGSLLAPHAAAMPCARSSSPPSSTQIERSQWPDLLRSAPYCGLPHPWDRFAAYASSPFNGHNSGNPGS